MIYWQLSESATNCTHPKRKERTKLFNVFFDLYYQKWAYASLQQPEDQEQEQLQKKECFIKLVLTNAAEAKFWKHKNVSTFHKYVYEATLLFVMLGLLITATLYGGISLFATHDTDNTMTSAIQFVAPAFFIFIIALFVLMPKPEDLTIVKKDIKQSANAFMLKAVQPLQDCCDDLNLDFHKSLPWLLSELQNYKSLYEKDSFAKQAIPQIKNYVIPVFAFFSGLILDRAFPVDLLLILFVVTITLIIVFMLFYLQIMTFWEYADKKRECMEDLRQAIQFCQYNK